MKLLQFAQKVRRDSGSFRDPGGFILHHGASVFRVILPDAVPLWKRFVSSGLPDELESAGLLVPTSERPHAAEILEGEVPPGSVVVEHERIPFVSYPYEWTFEMLRAAALLQLEIMERCLRRGWILKDASAYNVQFRGTRPVFIDLLSFSPLSEGEPWAGYNQFCRMMLYPLMLEAYKHIPFQPWLRSDLEGIDPAVFDQMLKGATRLRKGVLTHVTAQAYLQRKLSSTQHSVRQQIKSAGMTSDMIRRNVRGLRTLIEGLAAPRYSTTWGDYSRTHYLQEALQQKENFVRHAMAGRPLELVWDLGSNDGRFSRIAAESAQTVVAMDSDVAAVDGLFRTLREGKVANILPLLVNVANPSPAQGWAGTERASLSDRGNPDLTLALALVHHLVIAANVPVPALLQWLSTVTRELIVEFVSKDDPMVRRLLLNKDDTYTDYNREAFEGALHRHFRVVHAAEIHGGTRFLYHAVSNG